MADCPILFSGPMVRALVAGAKTQTRRLVKWQGPKGFPHSFEHAKVDNPAGVQRLLVPFNHPDEADEPWGENGYHRHYSKADPGDRFWVKENGWQRPDRTPQMMRDGADTWEPYYFDADLDEQDHRDLKAWGFKRRPSIHMPRVHSRLTLHVSEVRVQRLQDITPDDAAEEGAVCDMSPRTFIDHYRNIWERINGDGSWKANPWVFAYTFTVERANIDQTRIAA